MVPLMIMPGWMQTVSHISPVKWSILALLVGLVMLLVSVLRHRVFVSRSDPYKEIER